jgi:hypothetical protein
MVDRKDQEGRHLVFELRRQSMMPETVLSNRFEPFDVWTDWLGKTNVALSLAACQSALSSHRTSGLATF